MYQSPIDVLYGEIEVSFEDNILSAVRKVDINVDKDELLKALAYDRDQYRKGYEDAQIKWTRCRDRQPDESGNYLVTWMNNGKLLVDTDFYGKRFDTWDDLNDRVFAWAELPEPFNPWKENE